MVLTESSNLAIGSAAPEFTLPDTRDAQDISLPLRRASYRRARQYEPPFRSEGNSHSLHQFKRYSQVPAGWPGKNESAGSK